MNASLQSALAKLRYAIGGNADMSDEMIVGQATRLLTANGLKLSRSADAEGDGKLSDERRRELLALAR